MIHNTAEKQGKESVAEILQELRRYLPQQGPIKDFIADNIIGVFRDEGLTFHNALRRASALYGAREYRPISEYRKAWGEGKIQNDAIDIVLAREGAGEASLKEAMLTEEIPKELRQSGFRNQGYLHDMAERTHIVLEEDVHPILYRLLASFLDQGIAAVNLSENSIDFWQALRAQFAVLKPWGISSYVAQRVVNEPPAELIESAMGWLLPAGADRKTFLLEVLMAARGWSGIVAQVEARPAYLNYPRQIKLEQYVALYVAILCDALRRKNYVAADISAQNENRKFFSQLPPDETRAEQIGRLWHDAAEMSHYLDVLAAINTKAPLQRARSQRAAGAEFQAVFCIDDREESIRRHLEEVSAVTETFGAPGFFGIDMVYQGPFDTIAIKQCPVPVTPRYRVRGVFQGKRKLHISRIEMNFWHRHGNNVLLGSVISLFFGLLSLFRLGLSVHFPTRSFATVNSFAAHEETSELLYERASGAGAQGEYFEGYDVTEMAERVGRVLTQIGLTHHFAPLIAMVGHGSSSANNPFFAAYDCGACSGRPGLANARVFALMANRADVRTLLSRQGLTIPESTRFIGAIHDTTRDEILFLDEQLLAASHKPLLAKLKQSFVTALRRTALERSRRFADVPLQKSEKSAQKECIARSEMLFEPRPEYTHATNSVGIVAPRSLTEGLFLDRRAFFNSYEPQNDPTGEILSQILTPFVPVCAGINLAYYFSLLDNAVYGAGSKLPHNIFGLIGVGNGVDGDLRSGLPEQMIEIHDPFRLMIVIEQSREKVMQVLQANAAVYAWIKKDWVKLCVYDTEAQKYFWYEAGELKPLSVASRQAPRYENSRAAFAGERGNLLPGAIGQGGQI